MREQRAVSRTSTQVNRCTCVIRLPARTHTTQVFSTQMVTACDDCRKDSGGKVSCD